MKVGLYICGMEEVKAMKTDKSLTKEDAKRIEYELKYCEGVGKYRRELVLKYYKQIKL